MLLIWPLLIACPSRSGIETQLEREVTALSQRMRMLEEELASCGVPNAPKSLYAELFQVFSGTGVAIDQQGPATVITIPVGRLFTDPWGSAFRKEADMTMDILATALLLNPEYGITVVGHTSEAPIPATMKRRFVNHVDLASWLSARVTDHLQIHYSVPESRFTVASRGTWDAVATNATEEGQAANHRVEIRLIRSVSDPPEDN